MTLSELATKSQSPVVALLCIAIIYLTAQSVTSKSENKEAHLELRADFIAYKAQTDIKIHELEKKVESCNEERVRLLTLISESKSRRK